MLTTRSSKRDKVGVFNTDLMFDIMDGEQQVASLVYDKKAMRATMDVGAASYGVEQVGDQPDDGVYQALLRLLGGGEKPPAPPWGLKDSGGKILALAQQTKASFAISRGDESYTLRKKGRPFELLRRGNGDQPLGTVGQEKFFTRTLHIRLPSDLDRPFQVFLLTLVLTYTLQEMDKATT